MKHTRRNMACSLRRYFSNAFASRYSLPGPPSAWIMDGIIHKSRSRCERRLRAYWGTNDNLSIAGSIRRIIKTGARRDEIDSMQIASLFASDIIGCHKYSLRPCARFPHAFAGHELKIVVYRGIHSLDRTRPQYRIFNM